MIDIVSKWEGKEGICLYSPDGQNIWKIKTEEYKTKHRLKEEFGNIEKIVDFYISEKCPPFDVFQLKIVDVVDWETANEIVGDISKVCDAWKQVKNIMLGMEKFVNETLKPLPTRKDQAVKVLSAYGSSGRNSMVFTLLDGKSLTDDQIKKLLYQCLKK
jgi:hypothetical protein